MNLCQLSVICFLLTSCVFITAATTTVTLDANSLSIWPQPQIIKNVIESKPSLEFSRICFNSSSFVASDWSSLADCEKNFLSAALKRLSTRYSFPSTSTNSTNCVKFSLKKSTSTCNISLLNSSEKYEMWLNGNYTTIKSDNIYGTLRAIQTLAQIIDQAYSIVKNANSQVVISPIYIQDYPYYKYRGFMLDTARHFVAIDSVKRHVDSMEEVKLNAFHLHITDDESFPINMTKYSSSYKFNGGPLTFEILKDLKEYCADRGIEFIPEIDTPAHSTSWSTYYPSIMYSSCTNHLDVSKQETYQVVSLVYQFLFKLLGSWTQSTPRIKFTNQLVHTGLDEIDGSCYSSDSALQKYIQTVLNNVLQNGSTIAGDSTDKMLPIVWADDLITDYNIGNTSALPRDTILQIWRSDTTLAQALNYYYKTIVSVAEPWYIDAPCSRTFETIYQYKPPSHPMVIGGESCMWTSSSDTDADLEEYVWPRAAAVAERLWTNPCNPITFWNATYSYNAQKLSRKSILTNRIVKTGLAAQTYDCSSAKNPTFSSNCTSNSSFSIPTQPSLNSVTPQQSITPSTSSVTPSSSITPSKSSATPVASSSVARSSSVVTPVSASNKTATSARVNQATTKGNNLGLSLLVLIVLTVLSVY